MTGPRGEFSLGHLVRLVKKRRSTWGEKLKDLLQILGTEGKKGIVICWRGPSVHGGPAVEDWRYSLGRIPGGHEISENEKLRMKTKRDRKKSEGGKKRSPNNVKPIKTPG